MRELASLALGCPREVPGSMDWGTVVNGMGQGMVALVPREALFLL